jgi:two-component system CheB/CheR fusion protein
MNDDPSSPPVTSPPPTYFVGIGASAGGLEALETFFSSMPTDTGLALIVIQHLSPDYKSLMVELLSKRTAMPVRRAEEGMLVEPNTVYLIPPKKVLKIFHQKLLLTDIDPGKGINLPIDIFLRSLAEDQGEKAVGIILSGTGSDGVRGCRAIKEAGGMVMAQSPESAKFDGMPRAAIDTGLVDVVLPPEEMPSRLVGFLRRPFTTPADRSSLLLPDEDGLTRIFSLLREQSKLDFTFYKPSTVLRRIERRVSVCQCADLREYVRLMESKPSEVTTLYRELLIGVTSFFRDREVFDLLAGNYLTELLRNAEPQDEIRFWVAACSSGEEAYTLAILALECMEQLQRNVNIKIFATDVDRDAVLRAGNGVYSESIAADLPPGILGKYFTHRNNQYHVQRKVREMVVFAPHNLIKDPPFTNIDVMSCRNMLIYLQPVLQQKVFEFFNFSLKPKGLLLLGTSETPGDMSDYFEPLHNKFKIYRSRGRKHPSIEHRPLFSPMVDMGRSQPISRFVRSAHVASMRDEERMLERLLDTMAEEFVPMVAVVNESMELMHLAGDSAGLLRLPTGKQVNDVTRMAERELAIPLATGLQKVFSGQRELKYTNIRLQQKNGARNVQMHIRALAGKRGQELLAGVFIRDMPSTKPEAPSEHPVYDISQEAEQRIRDLEQELQFTKENLQATIEELETSNEELQATNEELLASNEELQSTNEELQSVNEELHTVNAEYQTKILELTEMTNDLENLMAATGVATLFLDENLSIRKYTPELVRIFRIIGTDIGRPFVHLTHTLVDADPLALVSEVARSETGVTRQVQTNEGGGYLMQVLPYQVGGGKPSGILLTFIDIGLLKTTELELREANAILSRTQELAGIGSWRFDLLTQTLKWSKATCDIFGVSEDSFPATYEGFIALVHPEDRDRVAAEYGEAVSGGKHYDVVHRIVRSDGEIRVVHQVSNEVLDDAGRPVASVGIIHDITETPGLLCRSCPRARDAVAIVEPACSAPARPRTRKPRAD